MSTVTKIPRPPTGGGDHPAELQAVLAQVYVLRDELCRAQGVAQLIAQVAKEWDAIEMVPIAQSADLLADVLDSIAGRLYERDLLVAARVGLDDDEQGGAA